MKTAREYILKKTGQACEFCYNLDVIPIVDAVIIMKQYAKQVAQQALNDAAENATVNISSIDGFGSFDTAIYSDGDGDTVMVNKESITKTEIKLP